MMHGHLPTAARLEMWGGNKGRSLICACGETPEWHGGKVAHLQHRMFACGCPEERATRKRWAAAVRSLAYSTVKHDRAGEIADVVAACWGADNRTGTSAQRKRMNRKSGRRPKCMTHHDGTWHIVGITVFDEDAHWGDPAHSEPDGDEQHEQGYIRAHDGEVAYDMDLDGVERAAGKVEASLRLLRRVRAMVDTSPWWMMKWPVAALGFLTTAMGASPDDGHEYARRLRLIMTKHMGDLWTAQVTRR